MLDQDVVAEVEQVLALIPARHQVAQKFSVATRLQFILHVAAGAHLICTPKF